MVINLGLLNKVKIVFKTGLLEPAKVSILRGTVTYKFHKQASTQYTLKAIVFLLTTT